MIEKTIIKWSKKSRKPSKKFFIPVGFYRSYPVYIFREKSRGACQALFATCQVLDHMPTLQSHTANNTFIWHLSSKYAPRTLECIFPHQKVTLKCTVFSKFYQEISDGKIVVHYLLQRQETLRLTHCIVTLNNIVRLISTLQYIFAQNSLLPCYTSNPVFATNWDKNFRFVFFAFEYCLSSLQLFSIELCVPLALASFTKKYLRNALAIAHLLLLLFFFYFKSCNSLAYVTRSMF